MSNFAWRILGTKVRNRTSRPLSLMRLRTTSRDETVFLTTYCYPALYALEIFAKDWLIIQLFNWIFFLANSLCFSCISKCGATHIDMPYQRHRGGEESEKRSRWWRLENKKAEEKENQILTCHSPCWWLAPPHCIVIFEEGSHAQKQCYATSQNPQMPWGKLLTMLPSS